MNRTMCLRILLAAFVVTFAAMGDCRAQAALSGIGVVILHGKGGAPTGHVAPLAAGLEAQGALVANLEMPWSRRREYDADVATGAREVDAALHALRGRGARAVFVVGHSLGGLFALHVGGILAVDGIVAIAPGGNVANALYREKLGPSLMLARRLVAEGKGGEKIRLDDFEGARGMYPVLVAPRVYLTWFDPDGAMNQETASRGVKAPVPVLFVVPRNDYSGLLRVRQRMFDALPQSPLTRLYEPEASHTSAPATALEEIGRWLAEVAGARR